MKILFLSEDTDIISSECMTESSTWVVLNPGAEGAWPRGAVPSADVRSSRKREPLISNSQRFVSGLAVTGDSFGVGR